MPSEPIVDVDKCQRTFLAVDSGPWKSVYRSQIFPRVSGASVIFLGECNGIVRGLQEGLVGLSDELVLIHKKLVTLRQNPVPLGSWEGSHKAELKAIMEKLRKIDSKHLDGRFLGPGGNTRSSKAHCLSFHENSFDIVQEIKPNEESKNVRESLKLIHDRLSGIRQELQNLVLTHRWRFRETGLRNYSLSLQEIDKMRIDGKFTDSDLKREDGAPLPVAPMSRTHTCFVPMCSTSVFFNSVFLFRGH
ncbi:hypothetical protein IW261DRAFT_1565584 [Armillaria novae-zelandiae]|uniref:Uncharacterized protein n=1 Tax=Armillaria novae-zelandiae TaxID=153914 RepID=A0AA39P572_9AGAR|nr:hypothetical protein IW261DRAFT_1565584 [Armillaria novae-zelandiae]